MSTVEQRERPLLLVDDDEDAHFFLRRSLQKLGLAGPADSVMGGEEAIAYLENCLSGNRPLPVLVLLDIKMPGRDGFDVLQWMHTRGLTQRVPVAMLTSSDEPRDLSRAMTLGANCYLTKPPEPAMLGEIVRSANLSAFKPAPPERDLTLPRKAVVLVVDDSALARKTLRHELESLGYSVEEADSGETAMTFCRATPPILVFLDMVLDGMQGLEVIRSLRAMRSNLRIIVVSGQTNGTVQSEARRAGALGFVSKPVDPEELKPAIQSALKSPQWQ